MRFFYLFIAVIASVGWYADYKRTEQGYDAYEACEKARQFDSAADLRAC